ncbi:MAG: DUF2231 domain-containing protein [Pseudomonadota bacterium]|nr:DUF2231 domain-containing protein [Pseudomonadota bacterium]
MRTPASIAGHPIHAMLIVFPVGLLIFSLICDIVSTRSADPSTWALVAFYTMVGGFIGALLAAVPGLIDLLSLADAGIKKTAIIHMSINLVAVALYAINIWMRASTGTNTGTPFLLSVVAVALLAVSGWLGGKMVHEHGVGVDVRPG